MLTTIPDFARAITESCRCAAASLNEEICRVERLYERNEALRELSAILAILRQRATREAHAATRDIVAVAAEVRDLWFTATKTLRTEFTPVEQIEVLEVFGELSASGCELHKSVNRLWELVKRMGGNTEGSEELTGAWHLFHQVQTEAGKAIKSRTISWQPKDPVRFEQGLLEIREGRTLAEDEARARFAATGIEAH